MQKYVKYNPIHVDCVPNLNIFNPTLKPSKQIKVITNKNNAYIYIYMHYSYLIN